MVTHYPYANLGHANHGWLDARHHFSFASYQDSQRQQFMARSRSRHARNQHDRRLRPDRTSRPS